MKSLNFHQIYKIFGQIMSKISENTFWIQYQQNISFNYLVIVISAESYTDCLNTESDEYLAQ